MSRQHYRILRFLSLFHFGRMSPLFGFYENLSVSFSPAYNHAEAKEQLSQKQREAFEEAFSVLKKADPTLKELIRQFS